MSASPVGVDHSDGSVSAVTATANRTSAANGWAWSQAIGRRNGCIAVTVPTALDAVVLLEDDRADQATMIDPTVTATPRSTTDATASRWSFRNCGPMLMSSSPAT